MESQEVIIARLVSGYLRVERCKAAYKYFLKDSRHLQRYNLNNLSKTKYFPTRFFGLTLEDILTEYFEIYQIIQGRLEATNYFHENHSKSSLLQQLLYLLNKVHSSRCSTPQSAIRSPEGTHLEDASPFYGGHNSDVEATPIYNLPGNIRGDSEEPYPYKTPRRSKDKSGSSTEKDEMADMVVNTEVLAQSLLENREFHEKIAETINKVAEKQSNKSTELDQTIKTVVRETEEDPIFDRILDEIIGSANIIDERVADRSSTAASTQTPRDETEGSKVKKANKKPDSWHENRGRSYSEPPMIQQQNNEAVRSIIANSNSIETQTQGIDDQGKSEVIVFDGSLDKYIVSNTYVPTQAQSSQTPLYINNTGGLLMLPSTVSTNVKPNLYSSTPQYYVINKKPVVSCYVPPAVITEQDILKMPTVIVNDERPVAQSVLSTPRLHPVKKILQPKPQIEIPTNIGLRDYLKNFDADEPTKPGLKNVIYPKSSVDNRNQDTASKKAPEVTIKVNDTPVKIVDAKPQSNKVIGEKKDLAPIDLTENTPVAVESVKKTTPKSGSHVRNLDFSTPTKRTCAQKRVSKAREADKNSAQRDQLVKSLFGSEVKPKRKSKNAQPWDADLRTIVLEDTNEPVNIENAQEPSKSEPSEKETEPLKKKTEPSKKKTEPSKKKTESKKQTRSPKKEEAKESSKRKRKTSSNKSRKKSKIEKNDSGELDTTDADGALLEAALKTPIKSEKNPDVETEKDNQHTDTKSSTSGGDLKGAESGTVIDKKKNEENTEDSLCKTILSPSKSNVNKRTLVNNTVDKSKCITPDNVKEDNGTQPLKANRNLIPMLETPLKTLDLPKTPGVQTPSDMNLSDMSSFTPFTKMLEANLKGLNIENLPTPSIPATPNFPPFTPTANIASPYPKRPTDYSTSSSYYQPSDNEQNQSLETQLLECEKSSENFTVKSPENPISSEEKVVETVKEHFHKSIIAKKNLNLLERQELSSSSSSTSSSSDSDSENESLDNWMEKESNDTIIFKKKVPETPKRTYMLRTRTASSTNSRQSEEKTVKPARPKSKSAGKTENKPSKVRKPQKKRSKGNNASEENSEPLGVEDKAKPVKSKASPKDADEKNVQLGEKKVSFASTEGNEDQNIISNSIASVAEENLFKKKSGIKECKIELSSVTCAQKAVLEELEEKRKRTIQSIKKASEGTRANRAKNSRFKIKPIANVTNGRRKPRKSDSPKKNVQAKKEDVSRAVNILKKNQKDSEDEEDKISLRLSLSDDEGKPSCVNTPKPMGKTKSDKSPDVEAKTLIEGLKERGIHLMQKKSSEGEDVDSKAGEQINKDRAEDADVENQDCTAGNQESESIACEVMQHSEMKTTVRELLDTQTFEEEHLHIVFDETSNPTRSIDTKELERTFIGKLYIDEIDSEIDILLTFTEFHSLIDIASDEPCNGETSVTGHDDVTKSNSSSDKEGIILDLSKPKENTSKNDKPAQVETKTVASEEKIRVYVSNTPESTIDDDLMTFALTGKDKEESNDVSQSPKSTKKRKAPTEENAHEDKKCETMLKHLNVDAFLNNIHGNRYVKK